MAKHRWKFFRAGGVDQVALRGGEDVAHLDELDQKLWVALAMPTKGVELDARTLELLDADKDGRIRAAEVLGAIAFLKERLVDLGDVTRGASSLALDRIQDEPLRAGAARILENLGKKGAAEITIEDVKDTAKIFAETRFNGDGVVPVEAAEDEAAKAAIASVIETHGSTPDRSGKPGVDKARLDAFFGEAKAFVEWHARGAEEAAVRVAGDATASAHDAVEAIAAKVDDYFVRCRLAAFDERAQQSLNGLEADYVALGGRELAPTAPDVAKLPLERVAPGRALDFDGAVNPAWRAQVGALATAATTVLGGKKPALGESDWEDLRGKLAPYRAWLASKPSTAVEKLGIDKVRAALAAEAAVRALLDKDLAVEAENARIVEVERLLHLHRDLWRLLHNFVNFADFYGKRQGVFQVGTLWLDGRSAHLCVDAMDGARHGSLAAHSATFLAYCDVTRAGEGKRTIAAAFTDGDADYLFVGRNGVFVDRQGRDWDATITKVVSNPISLREAFWAPYKKLVRLVEEQVGKRASAAEAANTAAMSETATAVVQADGVKPPPAAPESRKIDVGTVAAIGVAIGGIGAMVTGILSAFFGLGAWMPLGLIAVVLLISGPSLLLAWLKLRQRNIGPLLDANGWAVNGRARINVPFGGALTDVAKLPAGAERSLDDPYAEKHRPWRLYAFICVVLALGLAWYLGRLDHLLPAKARSTSVLKSYAPASTPTTPAPSTAAPAPAPAK